MAKISSTHLFCFFHCPIMCAALMCAGIVVAECFEARGRSLRIITASGGPSSAHGGRRGVAIKASAQDLHQLPGHRQHHDYNHQLASLISSALPLSPLLLSTKTITTVIDTNSKTIARLIYRDHPAWQQMTMMMSTMLDCVGSLVWGLLPLSLIHSDTLLYQHVIPRYTNINHCSLVCVTLTGIHCFTSADQPIPI